MNRRLLNSLSLLSRVLMVVATAACIDPGDPIEPTEGFLDRKAAYLQYCFDHNGPDQGGIYGQVCRLYLDSDSFNESAIYDALAKINNKEDTADFRMNAVLRLLYLEREHHTLPAQIRQDLEDAVLGFKYWLDEPEGPPDQVLDPMCWWSENHQILFHTAELLAGQLYPDGRFDNTGPDIVPNPLDDLDGRYHVAHATPLIKRWLEARGRFGFSEYHSNVYFNEDIPPLVNLVDFAQDPAIRTKAAMVLDLLAFDMAANTYKGNFATAHGRTYMGKITEGLEDSTREAAYIMLGLGEYSDVDNFSGAFLATSDSYWPPAVLEDIAVGAAHSFVHRQRDSIDLKDGPKYGIGYSSHKDVMFWWGQTGYAAPETIMGSFQLVDDFNLWEGFFWDRLALLKGLVGSPLLPMVALIYEPMSRGAVLESMNTYTYRTPYYQLSGAQDYKPGSWTGQVHAWQATIDRDAFVYTSYPGVVDYDNMGGPWAGGFIPRATLHENIGVFQYRRPCLFLLDDLLFTDTSHAYFPRADFDEVVETGSWVIGRKGEAYAALYSQSPTEWSTENNYELMSVEKDNTWIVELGDVGANGSFARFVADIESAEITIAEKIIYQSPSQGEVVVGWEGPFLVDGVEIDLGPYPRWDNDSCLQEFGTRVTDIRMGGQRMELDFRRGLRRYWQHAGTP